MGINYKHVQQTNMGAELRDIWGFAKDISGNRIGKDLSIQSRTQLQDTR
jgi:hypothetical protein